ncbi:hypothetical protein [Bacillus sp. FJAT-44742]|uniref:hypothetical protein n=1 Tax=Bacillus sp. FJAT-44742 TaxID=2014005 RepID=UPI000C23B3A0|nr:hypothetical protein [Bacillus sp. FJAT-44742]
MEKNELLSMQLECTMLFQSNPYMVETVEGLEIRLGRNKEELEPVIDSLLKQEIIQKIGDDSLPLFRYKEPAVTIEIDLTSELNKS